MSVDEYYSGSARYGVESVRFFDIAHEGAHIRAVAEAAGALAHLAEAAPRSIVIVATDQIAHAAAQFAVSFNEPLRWPVMVARRLPTFVGPLDIVLVVGDAPDAETVTRDLTAATGRGAETILAGPGGGPVVEDAPGSTVALPSPTTSLGASPLRTIAAVHAVLSSLSGYAGQLDGIAEDVDAELRQLSPERDDTVNLARQLRELAVGARVVHTGLSPEGQHVAQLVATLWSARGLPSGYVNRDELALALSRDSSHTQAEADLFFDPFIDGNGQAPSVVPIRVVVWGDNDPRMQQAQLPGARVESVEHADGLTAQLCLIVRGYAATAMTEVWPRHG